MNHKMSPRNNKKTLKGHKRSQSDFSVKIREGLNQLNSIKEKASMDFVNERKMRLRKNKMYTSKTFDEITSIKEVNEPNKTDQK